MFKGNNKEFILSGKFEKCKQIDRDMYKGVIQTLHTRDDFKMYDIDIDQYGKEYRNIKHTIATRKLKYRAVLESAIELYPIVIFVELGFKSSVRECKYSTLRKYVTRVVSSYPSIGYYWFRSELSDKGYYHVHGFIFLKDLDFNDIEIVKPHFENYKDKKVWVKNKLKSKHFSDNWYGKTIEIDGKKQPSKFGIYDLRLMDVTNNLDMKKTINYAMKGLNRATAYIEKGIDVELCNSVVSVSELLDVQSSNVISMRNSLVSKWNDTKNAQVKEIRSYMRSFDTESIETTKYFNRLDLINYAIENGYNNNPWTNILNDLLDLKEFKKIYQLD